MNEVIERVARAICERRGGVPFPQAGTALWYDLMFDAKSTIEAMREPPEDRCWSYELQMAAALPDNAANIWRAMIDEALK